MRLHCRSGQTACTPADLRSEKRFARGMEVVLQILAERVCRSVAPKRVSENGQLTRTADGKQLMFLLNLRGPGTKN